MADPGMWTWQQQDGWREVAGRPCFMEGNGLYPAHGSAQLDLFIEKSLDTEMRQLRVHIPASDLASPVETGILTSHTGKHTVEEFQLALLGSFAHCGRPTLVKAMS